MGKKGGARKGSTGSKKSEKKGKVEKKEKKRALTWGVNDHISYKDTIIIPDHSQVEVSGIKSVLKAAKRKDSKTTVNSNTSAASKPLSRLRSPTILQDFFVTELARVKHYVLSSIIKNDGSWSRDFGTYICGEAHSECKLPYLDSSKMASTGYLKCSKIYSLSSFHMNIHRKSTLKKVIQCGIGKCKEMTFKKADVFLRHMETSHPMQYTHYWNISKYAFKPNAKQYLYGLHNAAFDNTECTMARWACIQCREIFERPEDWQNHRQFRQQCLQQVVEIIYNKLDMKSSEVKNTLWSDKEIFCSLCSVDGKSQFEDEDESESDSDSDSVRSIKLDPKKSINVPVTKDSTDEAEYLDSGSTKTVLIYGSIKEMINHICEKHTHKAFICLSCDKVMPINNKKHFVNCLQCTEEGLSMTDMRKYPISKQIKGWANSIIANMIKNDILKEVVDGEKNKEKKENKKKKHA